ncbi:MAG: type 1 glutamine amidotransferase [Planctomycetota bacterium]
MARVLVIQHGPSQTPGRLGMTLRDHGFSLDVRRPDLPADRAPAGTHTHLPSDLDGIHAVISLGGLQSTTDPHPWLDAERDLLKRAHDKGLAVVGICLGHQLLAQALGGEVGEMDKPEAGFVDVKLTIPAQTESMLGGIAWTAPQFQSHRAHVTKAPPGATVLATSEACPVQAFKIGLRTYSFQYHFECDRAMIETFSREQQALFTDAGVSPDVLSDQADNHYEMFARLADRLCVNLASYAFPFSTLTAV